MTQPSEPSSDRPRKWVRVSMISHGGGYALSDDSESIQCSLWQHREKNKPTNRWFVRIGIRDKTRFWGSKLVFLELGEHEEPPFDLAEDLYDAAK